MKTIIIKTQEELDKLPLKFYEFTEIQIKSDSNISINVKNKYDNSRVVAYGSSTVVAWDSSRVEARDSSRVEARDSSRVEAYGSSRVIARDSSRVEAYGSSRVEAYGSSRVIARDSSTVVAYGSSRVEAYGSSRVECFQSSFVMIFSVSVIIKRLLDYSTAHFKNIKPKVEEKSENATVKFEPEYEISFEEWLRRGYVSADGIIEKLISQKKIGEIEVFEVEEFLENKSSYVVKRGDAFSHGETVEKAIKDLRYKITDRDTSKYNHWKSNLDLVVSLDEAIQGYRVITGACELGTKYFIESLGNIEDSLTIKEIIEKTKGKFGNKEFTSFVGLR